MVPAREKQEAVAQEIRVAASNHTPDLTLNTHHRLAAELSAVSASDVRGVMGDPAWYGELIGTGASTETTRPAGSARRVDHTFGLWLAYEYEDRDQYAGSTQETWNELVEGTSPDGIFRALRQIDGYTDTPSGKVHILQPVDVTYFIDALFQANTKVVSAHQAAASITVRDFPDK